MIAFVYRVSSPNVPGTYEATIKVMVSGGSSIRDQMVQDYSKATRSDT